MSAVAMANTALAHDAQLSVRKRSAWRAWFELRLYEHTFGLEEPPSAEIGRRRTSEAHGCHARLPPCAAPETENCSCKALAAAGILRRPTVLKELLLLPSLLPLLMMMTLMTLLLLLHCRCRCRRCCRGFHCRCCCTAVAAASAGCRRSERQPLLQLSLTRAAAASRRVRRQRAAGRRGDASGTRRGSGGRGPCVRLLPAARKMTRTHARTHSLTDPHKAIVVI